MNALFFSFKEGVPPDPPDNVYLRFEKGNIMVSWLKPRNSEQILIRAYVIDVFHNKTKREAMEVGYKESSVVIYEVGKGRFKRLKSYRVRASKNKSNIYYLSLLTHRNYSE